MNNLTINEEIDKSGGDFERMIPEKNESNDSLTESLISEEKVDKRDLTMVSFGRMDSEKYED